MQIKDPGFFSRGKIILPPSPHITPDSLLQELQQQWGPRGYEVYKTALIGADLVLKKSGWTGIAMKINQGPAQTEIIYNAFSPSVFVRLLAMGLIPLLIVYSNSWKPLLQDFRMYVQSSPFWGGQLQGGGYPQQLGMGQPGMGQPGMGQPGMGQPGMGQPGMQPGMAPTMPYPQGQQGYPGQPGMQQPGQPGMQQPQQGMGQPGMQQPGWQQPQQGMGQPGMQQPGMQQPQQGMGQPGMQQPQQGQNPGLAGTMLMPNAPPPGGPMPGQGGPQGYGQ